MLTPAQITALMRVITSVRLVHRRALASELALLAPLVNQDVDALINDRRKDRFERERSTKLVYQIHDHTTKTTTTYTLLGAALALGWSTKRLATKLRSAPLGRLNVVKGDEILIVSKLREAL